MLFVQVMLLIVKKTGLALEKFDRKIIAPVE